MIAVVAPGLFTTVQDSGRPGHRASGVPLSGAMDRFAHAVANLLAGNLPGAAALELTYLGGTFRVEEERLVAVTGAELDARLDGRPLEPWSAVVAPRGAVIAFGHARGGARAYLAVEGGIDVPPVLGSRSTSTRGAIGGHQGRTLRAGDRLPLGARPARSAAPRALPAELRPVHRRELRLRLLPGPQDDLFTPAGLATLVGEPYRVTPRNDRMGYQLDGPRVELRGGADIVSDALLPGAVQVPGSGLPIVMTADCQTTGGYAKVGAVIGPDLDLLAQAPIGAAVRFEPCGDDEAVAAARAARDRLAGIARLLGAPWAGDGGGR